MGNLGAILLEADLPATGDEGFERLCREMRPRALKFAFGMVPDHGRAEELRRRERLVAVEHAVQQLPGAERAALLLREIEGLSYAQIAQSLGTSVSDVNNLIHRARGRFAELMRPWMEA